VLNFGRIKMPTTTAFDFRIKGCVDAEMGGLSYIGSAEGHEYPDLQVGDEVNPRPFFMPL
jgi:hypothetical protein